MKPSKFYWQWSGESRAAPDPTMTRARMAQCIRAWRQHGYAVVRLGPARFRLLGPTGQRLAYMVAI